MEGEIKWHYMPMSDDEFSDAISQVNMRLEQLLLEAESA